MRNQLISSLVCSTLLLTAFHNGTAQNSDDADLAPGVLLKLTAGEKSVERIEDDISVRWGSFSPDRRLATGPFRAEWKSQLLLREAGEYRLWAWVQGDVSVQIDGQEVLQGSTDTPRWLEGSSFQIGFGLKRFLVNYRKTSDAAELHLYWSNEPAFPLEPLPAQVLFRDGGRQDLAEIERGRQLFEAHRCAACHNPARKPRQPAAPDLQRWVSSLESVGSLKQTLAGHGTGLMPAFGLTGAQVDRLWRYLVEKSEQPKLEAFPGPEKGRNDAQDLRSGLTLLKATGCLACHQINGEGIAGPYSATDLSSIGFKRSREWFYTWLKEPARLNRHHRMPVFSLSRQKRRQIALALVSLRKSNPDIQLTDTRATTSAAREIITAARCAACHALPASVQATPVNLANLPTLESPVQDWSQSCLAETPDPSKWRPAFPGSDRQALQSYVESFSGSLSKQSSYERGRQLFISLNCQSCHPRHTGRGLAAIAGAVSEGDTNLRGQAPSLVPPSLTAVGDKLLDEALTRAVSGGQKRRMDWIHARMPEFQHSRDDHQALITYFVEHDRIPDNAPTWNVPENVQPVPDRTVALGQDLAGPKGFSCIACHQAGSYVPLKAAMGTRGSDIAGLGSRMRYPYFVRWTRSPLRVVPGTEMPSYIRPVQHVLNNNIELQLQTLWQSLNHSKFSPPTNPSAVEQYVTLEPGDTPRIIRDVFTNPDANGGGYVARAFAVGFNNQHSVLIDLDTLTLRSWCFGDFARQRTVGKSWYWDMAGSPVVTGIDPRSDYALVPKIDPDQSGSAGKIRPARPVTANGTAGRLIDYSSSQEGVQLRYRLNFQVDGKPIAIHIAETLKPISQTKGLSKTGVRREIRVTGLPADQDLQISFPHTSGKPTFGQPRIQRENPADAGPAADDEADSAFGRRFSRVHNTEGQAACVVVYTCDLAPAPLTVNLKPAAAPTASPVTSMPGFDGITLPLPRTIMPTAMTILKDGTLAFTSLKGHVYLARDTDGDGLQDSLQTFEEGLAAPYGIIEDGDSIIVSQKPELTRLRDTDGDGHADQRSVYATGWGFNDNYHDWTCGIARDSRGNLYVGLGSNYGQPKRPKEYSLWRGSVVKVSPEGTVTPFSSAFRYPTGLAIDSQDRLFASDNQGVQNCFNEINHLREGLHFGVPNYHDRDLKVKHHPPAVQVPHPWVRSVNGLQILPDDYKVKALAGHGIGCEYEEKLLVRFTSHEVKGNLQGAIYYLSRPKWNLNETFLGPLCAAVAPNGDLYVGSIHDSGWLGGLNTGNIVRLRPNGSQPNGIREIRGTADGFEIRFQQPVDRAEAAKSEHYSISGYTRVWGGSYATPDSGRYQAKIKNILVNDDASRVRITVDRIKAGFVYDVNCQLRDHGQPLWPDTGYYSMTNIPD